MMIVVTSLAVAMVAFILYALDRKAKSKPISWETAGKLSLFGCLITSGVVFATTAEGVTEVAKKVAETVTSAQDMFVGQPTF